MQFTLHQDYLTREGKRVTLLAVEEGHCYPLVFSDGQRRRPDGAYASSRIFNLLDIERQVETRPKLFTVRLIDADLQEVEYRRSALNPQGAIAAIEHIIERDDLAVVEVVV